jgi:hypothetical protein
VALLTISIFFKDLFAVPRPAIKTETASDDDRTPTDVDSSSKAKPDVDQLSANFAQSLTLEEEIDIDASSADMILFADLLQFTVRFSRFGLNNHLQVTLEQAGVLLSLADMYDCAAMRRILQRTVAQKSTHMPWQVLALACDQDDVNLARTAISNLSEKFIHDATQNGNQTSLWDNLSKLNAIWQLEFLRLYMPSTRRHELSKPHGSPHNPYAPGVQSHVLGGQLDGNFATWAKLFDPTRYEG